MSIEEAILEKVRALPPKKREEVLEFANSLSAPAMGGPLRNPEGLWAGFDFAISEKDITELRDEMWQNFPRDDI